MITLARPRSFLPLCVALLALVTASSCDSQDDETQASEPPRPGPSCQPDAARYEADIAPQLQRYCGSCHGDAPTFGASASLSRLEDLLLVRADGTRLVERIADRLAQGTMPPSGMPRVPRDDAAAIVRWATCGATDAVQSSGIIASAPPLLAPESAPPGLEHLDLRAPGYPVAPDAVDDYHCFVFDADLPSDRFVRRFDMIYGEPRVLHHVILSRDSQKKTPPGDFGCNGGGGVPVGSEYLYTWAPGQSALEFPAGGLRVRPGDRFIVQVHYNNGSRLDGVLDTSGVRLHVGPVEGPEYGMFSVGSLGFSLPAHQKTDIRSKCTLKSPLTLLAGMPHMHLLGSSFDQRIERAGGSTSLIQITGWRFDSQFFYSLPATLAAGDVLATTCSFDNPTDSTVQFGEGTRDEMCNNFLYATPPPAFLYCDDGAPPPSGVAYTPGKCWPPGGLAETPEVQGEWQMALGAPEVTPGVIPEGRWVLKGATMLSTGGETPLGSLDFASSQVQARGQVMVSEGQLIFDVATRNIVALDSGSSLPNDAQQSFAVPFDGVTSPVEATPACPQGAKPVVFSWGLADGLLVIVFERKDVPGMTLWPRYEFALASP